MELKAICNRSSCLWSKDKIIEAIIISFPDPPIKATIKLGIIAKHLVIKFLSHGSSLISRLEPWLRNLLTSCLAIIPSLIVALIDGSARAGKLIIIASMILSFELPFALVPLLKFTSCKTKMGPHVNPILISGLTWVIGGLIMGINIYDIVSSFIKLLIHSEMKLAITL